MSRLRTWIRGKRPFTPALRAAVLLPVLLFIFCAYYFQWMHAKEAQIVAFIYLALVITWKKLVYERGA